MERRVDVYSREYDEFEKANREYFKCKELLERYAMMHRITREESYRKWASDERRKLPALASNKRKTWYALLKKTRGGSE
ncbi:hypothetical protein PDM92_21435 [Bacillus cereus]|nr:hypothetical protein [Bacillus cereus]